LVVFRFAAPAGNTAKRSSRFPQTSSLNTPLFRVSAVIVFVERKPKRQQRSEHRGNSQGRTAQGAIATTMKLNEIRKYPMTMSGLFRSRSWVPLRSTSPSENTCTYGMRLCKAPPRGRNSDKTRPSADCGVEQCGQISSVSGSASFCCTSASHGSGETGASRTQTMSRHAAARGQRGHSNFALPADWIGELRA